MALEYINGVAQIRTAADFIEFRSSNVSSSAKRSAVQLADIDLAAYTLSSNQRLREITYDGLGYIIKNAKGGAIFGVADGEFKNVHARNAEITAPSTLSGDYGGGLGGFISTPGVVSRPITMTNCSFEGAVKLSGVAYQVGGFVGSSHIVNLTDCHFKGSVDDVVTSTAGNSVGGLVGFTNRGSITRCSSEGGQVSKNNGLGNVGGIIGIAAIDVSSANITLTDCASSLNIVGGVNSGGLIGSAPGRGGGNSRVSAINCSAEGNISTMQYGAGLIGSGSYAVIQNCFALNPIIAHIGSGSYMLSDIIARIQSAGTVVMENNSRLDTIEFLGA